MKSIFIFLSIVLYSFSIDAAQIPRTYQILSDKFVDSIPEGKCLIYGTVYHNGNPVNLVMISNEDETSSTITNDQGNFKFYFPIGDSNLYCFKSGLTEIVVSGYHFQSQHAVQINFYQIIPTEIIIYDKPIIYLYPEVELNIEVQIQPKAALTFTYPTYHNGWTIQADPNGTLTDPKTKKTYPYLFWEAKAQIENIKSRFDEKKIKGFLIETNTIVSFLEEKLEQIGLNDKEATDFITYWAPRMQNKAFALIQFLIDEEYDSSIASIEVTPKPQSMKRVFMLYTIMEEMDNDLKIIPQQFEPFDRKGFTVIEWGGTELKNQEIIN